MRTFLLRTGLLFVFSNIVALFVALASISSSWWDSKLSEVATVYWFYSFPFAFLVAMIGWRNRRKA